MDVQSTPDTIAKYEKHMGSEWNKYWSHIRKPVALNVTTKKFWQQKRGRS